MVSMMWRPLQPAQVAPQGVAGQDAVMGATTPPPEMVPHEIGEALLRMGLASGEVSGERLTGGVSSDIWRISLPGGPICVKRALGKLPVSADWQAPRER